MADKVEIRRDFQGEIVELARKGVDVCGDSKKVVVSVKTLEGLEDVDLPIETKSSYEIIPYEDSMIGSQVHYVEDLRHWENGRGRTTTYRLKFLSGKSNGKTFSHNYVFCPDAD